MIKPPFGAVSVSGGIMRDMSRAMLGWPLCTDGTASGGARRARALPSDDVPARYVTYCIRRRRFNAALDAATLFRKIAGQ